MVSEKGQAFAPFRMLIGAIMALLILVIIIGAIDYFDGLRVTISRQRFYDGLDNAINQPNEGILVVNTLQFMKGTTFSGRILGRNANLGEDCVEFVDNSSPSMVVDSGEQLISIKETVLTDVFMRCETNVGSCEVYCDISFGDEFN